MVPDALSSDIVGTLNEVIDRDLAENQVFWFEREDGRSRLNVHILAAQLEMDATMRPSSLLPLLEAIMGSELCAEEHSVRIRIPNPDGRLYCRWHRDASHMEPDVPYRTRYISVVYYLTDVDESAHTFSVIPGSAQTAELPPLEHYDLETAHHVEGRAGTAILLNAAMVHAGKVRRTPSLTTDQFRCLWATELPLKRS